MGIKRLPRLISNERVDITYDTYEIFDPMMAMYTPARNPIATANNSTVEYYPLPQKSDLYTSHTNIQRAISNSETNNLMALLESDFIFDVADTFSTTTTGYVGTHSPLSYENGNIYKYQDTLARSTLEQVLLKTPQYYKTWLDETRVNNPDVHAILLEALKNIKLEKDECINFSYFNLTNANFHGAELAKSDFTNAIVTDADFSNSDISHCTISQAQLDATNHYANAKIPNGYWQEWDDAFIKELSKRFDNLKAYVDENIDELDPKNLVASSLYNDYKNLLTLPKISSDTKRGLLDNLTNAATLQTFSHNRNLRFLIGEIIGFILLAGVGYLIAASVMKYRTGHFGLFKQPRTENMVKGIAHKIENSRAQAKFSFI